MLLIGPGEPLGAFLAAYTAIELGGLLSGKTKIDIILTPLVSIGCGSAVGLILGPPISTFMAWLGSLINWGTEQQPLVMGVVVSVLMGMILTLPISSTAIGVVLNLSGLAAGAATIGRDDGSVNRTALHLSVKKYCKTSAMTMEKGTSTIAYLNVLISACQISLSAKTFW